MNRSAWAFSLIELVIVVVIVGVIAAIAIPRMAEATARSQAAAVSANRVALMKAIEYYAAEHNNAYPDVARIVGQLTQYTDFAGNVSVAADATHIYGPYIRKIPAVAIGGTRWQNIDDVHGPGVGWIYRPATGNIYPNVYQSTLMMRDGFLSTVLSSDEKAYLLGDGELPP